MRCLYPWTQLYIEGTGVVKPCCSLIELGNLRHAGIVDVLASANAEALCGAHARGAADELPGDCRGCYALARQADLHSFNGLYDVGADPEQGLMELARLGYQAFVDNYRVVRDCYVRGQQLPAGAKPLGLWCQLGEHCNIRCVMCWQDHNNPVRLSPAQIDQVRALIPTLHTLQFTGGEPTLYKEFWELIDHFRAHAPPRSKVMVLTNALLLKGKLHRFDGIGRLVLAVNVDGPTRASYEKIRYGGKWDTLIANLEAIREYRARADNASRVSVTMAFTLMKSNIDLIPEGIALAEEYAASWTCGIITGEFAPVSQCRTYFEENIFRFAHLGCSKEAIVARLQEGVELARASTHSSGVSVSCLEATIALVRQTEQIWISPEKAALMRTLTDDHQLSRAIQDCVLSHAAPALQGGPPLIQLGGLKSAAVETARANVARRTARRGRALFRRAMAFCKTWRRPRLAVWHAWLKRVAAMPIDKQLAAVGKELKKRNADFDGKIGFHPNTKRVVVLAADHLTDISPLQALPWITGLVCSAGDSRHAKLADLSPLKDMKLIELALAGTSVTDLSPLQNTPLEQIWCDFRHDRDAAILRSIKTLKTINGKPAAEVLR